MANNGKDIMSENAWNEMHSDATVEAFHPDRKFYKILSDNCSKIESQT